MQFQAQQKDLLELGKLSRIVNTNYPNVKIEAKSNDRLKLTTTNGDLTMEVVIPCMDAQGEAITIDCRKFYAIVATLDSPIKFKTITKKNGGLTTVLITAGKKKASMAVYDVNNFPEVKPIKGEKIVINSKELVENLKHTLFATLDDFMSVLKGVSIKNNEIVATTASILALHKLSTDIIDKQVILPKPLADEIIKCFIDEELTISTNEVKISFATDNLTLTSTLIDGQYPKYEAIIPKKLKNSLIIDKQQLVRELEFVSLLKNDKTNLCLLTFNKNELVISADNKADGEEGTTSIDIEYLGDELTAGFFLNQLIACLKNTNSDVLTIEFNNAESAFLIKSDEDNLNLIMPTRLRG